MLVYSSSLLSTALLLLAQFAVAEHERPRDLYARAQPHGMQDDDILRRQDSSGDATTSGLQAFSTTYSYSFTSYTPITAMGAASFSSAIVTRTTIITVYASDSFHAFQSLLTAGQSVQDQANFIAALVTLSIPAMTTTDAYTTPTVTSIRNMASSTSTYTPTWTGLVLAPSTSSVGAACSTAPRLGQGVALVGAFIWANW